MASSFFDGILRIPEDQRLAANQWSGGGPGNGEIGIARTGQRLDSNARLKNGGLCDLHNLLIVRVTGDTIRAMKKPLFALTLAAVWSSVVSAPIAQEKIDKDIQWKIRREATDNSQIMRTMHFLTDVYGPRLTGSPNLKAAQDWIVKETTRWGLKNAHLEPWSFGHPGWVNEKLSVHAISPFKDALVAEALAWTPGTNGPVTAQVVQIIDAAAADEGRADEVLRRQPRESEGQDRDGRRAGSGAGDDPDAAEAPRRQRRARAVRSGQSRSSRISAAAVPQRAAESERRSRRTGRASSSISSWSPPAPSAASTMPAASTDRFAPSTTAPSTSRRRCRRS